jgi:hypothetical protein
MDRQRMNGGLSNFRSIRVPCIWSRRTAMLKCRICGREYEEIPASFVLVASQRITGRNGSRLYKDRGIVHDIRKVKPKKIVALADQLHLSAVHSEMGAFIRSFHGSL